MNHPSVSVCVPTYNGTLYLKECLESVLAQTYRNIEVIVVDDCSTDGTVLIAEEIASRDRRVRVERNIRNRGLMGNWERCIELSSGEYIKFAFQDDLLFPDCIESLVSTMRDGVRFAFCAREFIVEERTSEALVLGVERGRELIARLFGNHARIDPGEFCRAALEHAPTNIIGEPTVTLVHRDVLARYGAFNPHFTQLLDFEYWCRVAVNEPIAYVPKPLVAFRLHPESASSLHHSQKLYQAEVLDRLLLLHEFAFSPTFENLRRVARNRPFKMDLADMFYTQTHWASSMAKEKLEGEAPLEALNALAESYPAFLDNVPLRYLLYRKWRSLKDCVKKKMGSSEQRRVAR